MSVTGSEVGAEHAVVTLGCSLEHGLQGAGLEVLRRLSQKSRMGRRWRGGWIRTALEGRSDSPARWICCRNEVSKVQGDSQRPCSGW